MSFQRVPDMLPQKAIYMIKILHTADVHLDSPLKSLALRDESLRDTVLAATRTAFAHIVETALSEQVSAVLISGDLFDGKERSARTAAFLTAQMERLRTADIRVFYIKGNHDAENPVTGTLICPPMYMCLMPAAGKCNWVKTYGFMVLALLTNMPPTVCCLALTPPSKVP